MLAIHWTMTTIITAASVASSVLVGAVLGIGKLLDVLRPQIRKLKATVDDFTSLVESLSKLTQTIKTAKRAVRTRTKTHKPKLVYR
jgi:hypothetical protein